MARSIIGGSYGYVIDNDVAIPRYYSLFGASTDFYSGGEEFVQFDYRGIDEGTTVSISKLAVHVQINENVGPAVFTVRINGENGAGTITVPAGETGWFSADSSLSDDVGEGDKVAVLLTRDEVSLTPKNFNFDSLCAQLLVSGSTQVVYASSVEDQGTPANTEYENRLYGGAYSNTEGENDLEYRHRVKSPFTMSYLQAYCTSNEQDGDYVITVLKNDTPTDLQVTITAGQTGAFIDATHSVHFDAGDKISRHCSSLASTTGFIELSSVKAKIVSDDDEFEFVCGGEVGPLIYATGPLTNNFTTFGILFDPDYDQDVSGQGDIRALFPMELSKLRVNLTNMAKFLPLISSPIYVRTLINGEPGNQYIEVPTPETADYGAYYEDDTNVDTVALGDVITVEFGLISPNPEDPNDGMEGSCFDISMSAIATDEDPPSGCVKDCECAMTFSELRTATLAMLGEDTTSPVYWSANEIGRLLNDAYVEACRESGALEIVEAIELPGDDSDGTLSDRVDVIQRVTFDDQKIVNVTKWELDRADYGWETLTGQVTAYITSQKDDRAIQTYKIWDGSGYYAENLFVDGAYTYAAWVTATAYAVGDRVTITATSGATRGFVCIEAHTSGGTSEPDTGATWETYWIPLALVVWAKKNPVLLSTDCDVPELPPWTHIALCYRAASRALLKYGEQRNEPMSKFYDTLAKEYLTMLKGFVGNRTPEALTKMGRVRAPNGLYRPMPWDQTVVGS